MTSRLERACLATRASFGSLFLTFSNVKIHQSLRCKCLSGYAHLFLFRVMWTLQWQTLAQTAKAKSCYWRFVLLNLEILQAHISTDGSVAGETAEIEALLEEAAELVDESQPKNAKYYR